MDDRLGWRAEDGAAESFDAFYSATVRRLAPAVYAMCGDLSEAQDCTQEAYLRAWQRWSSLRDYDDPEGWVRTVARRVAVSRWRRLRTTVRARVALGEPGAVDPPGVDHVAIIEALRTLPEPQRRALVLYHLVGLSVDEVAAETGAPVGTVKARLSRGRAALAPLLSLEPFDRRRGGVS
jgi:RNA polymerase sigma-70 factor (ECF subfamily)